MGSWQIALAVKVSDSGPPGPLRQLKVREWRGVLADLSTLPRRLLESHGAVEKEASITRKPAKLVRKFFALLIPIMYRKFAVNFDLCQKDPNVGGL